MPSQLDTWNLATSFAPLVASSVIGFAVALWKWRVLRQPTLPACGLAPIRDRIRAGDFSGAAALTETRDARLAPLLAVLLGRGERASPYLAEYANQAGARVARELEYGLGVLTLIGTLGPLFGLLGTVIGITLVFHRMADTVVAPSIQQLAGGIGTALYTTIGGLIVGVLALVSHRYLAGRVDRSVADVEAFALELVDAIAGDDTPPA